MTKLSATLAALTVMTGLTHASLVSQCGILDLTANGGINPNTGLAWQLGDQYRLAFHTAEGTTAASNDPDFYNAFVTAQAHQNPALAGTEWYALVMVNLDGTVNQADSPKSDPKSISGTSDLTGGTGQGGAGVPVYAMDGKTCIARNNAQIWNSWRNPFETGWVDGELVVDPTGNGNNAVRWAAGTGPAPASQTVHYSPFLDQFGNQTVTPDTVHGINVWTGMAAGGTEANPLGNTLDVVRAAGGNANANTTGRIWHRFQSDTPGSQSFYALSELLTVQSGAPAGTLIILQ